MGFVVYNRDTNECVEMNTQNSKYKITKDISRAHSFKKRKSATNFLGCDTQKILTKAGWDVVSEFELKQNIPIIKASEKVSTELDDMEKLQHFEHFEANADLSDSFKVPNIDIVATIRSFEEFLKKMQEYASVLSKQYTYIEYCKLDYEHKMELYSSELNLLKRTELSTNYTACLRERRRIKDDILILEKLLSSSVAEIVNGDLDEFLKKLDERHYIPRVAPELFETLDTVQVKPKFSLDNVERSSVNSEIMVLNQQTGSFLEMLAGFNPIPDCGE